MDSSSFGVDFVNCVDKGVRTWMVGGDPYAKQSLWLLYPYPPIVLRLFMWVELTTPYIAVRIWICIAAAFAAVGALAAAQTRQELGLDEIPRGLAVALILFSFPVLFELDRGNYDLIVVPLIVGAVLLMRRKTSNGDVIAGFLLAIAIWSKLYPGLLIFGVLALRRWRLGIWLAAFGALIGLADPPQLLRCMANSKVVTGVFWNLAQGTILPWCHNLPPYWQSLWADTPFALLPGQLGAGLLLGSLLVWVSWRISQSPQRDRLSMPYFFWLIALGSFVPTIANDYNLTPLPLAALATWSREDPWVVHAALATLILWWQPIALPLPGRAYLFIKLAGLAAVGYSLITQASRLSNTSSSEINKSDYPFEKCANE